ncbi:MAG: hypothetical protein ABIS26_01155, partial [Candidatus Paceibacterota bacterium]
TFNNEGTYPISQFLSGLSESTTYYFRLEVTNDYGTQNLNINNFTTPQCSQTYPTPSYPYPTPSYPTPSYPTPSYPYPTPSYPTPYVNPTVNLSADQTTIPYNSSTIVRWTSSNASSCIGGGGVNGWAGAQSLSGTFSTGALTQGLTFYITCYGSGGAQSQDSVSINVNGPTYPTPSYPYPTPSYPTPTTVSACRVDSFPADTEYNGSVTLTWRTSNSNNVILSGGQFGSGVSVNPSGTKTIGIDTNTLFTITAKGPNCSPEASMSSWMYAEKITTYPTPSYAYPTPSYTYPTPSYAYPTPSYNLSPSVNIWADRTNVRSNESTVVHWDSINANYCTASGGSNNWSGAKALAGTFYTGTLSSSRTFSITCSNSQSGQSNSDSVTINVNSISLRPNVNIYADDTSLQSGDSTRIHWDSDNADRCEATSGTNGWSGNRGTSGSFNTGSLTSSKTYRIECTNDDSGQSESDSVTVDVSRNTNNNNNLDVRISADNTNLIYGGSTTVRWNTNDADSCYGSGGSNGWQGNKSSSGGSFSTGPLTFTTTYSINCSGSGGSDSDSVTVFVNNPPTVIQQPPVVIQQPPTIIRVPGQVLGASTGTSMVLLNSSVDRNQPIVPSLDNTNPCPGDEVTYNLNYQNVGTASIKNAILRVDLPYEVDYLYSNINPMRSGNSLVFNIGNVAANGQGSVTIRVRVKDNVPAGANLNFPGFLTYVDSSGFPQSVATNVNAQVCGVKTAAATNLGANVFGAGLFFPGNIFSWLLLLILILLIVLAVKNLYNRSPNNNPPAYSHYYPQPVYTPPAYTPPPVYTTTPPPAPTPPSNVFVNH